MSDDGLAMDLEYYAMLEAAANATHAAPPPAQVAIDPVSPPRNTATGAVLEGVFKIGDKVQHRLHNYQGHVLHLGTASSAPWHQGKVCFRYQRQVNKSKKEWTERWCDPSDLMQVKGSPRKAPRLDAAASSADAAPAAASTSAERPGVDTEDDTVPELAEHERGRKLPQNQKSALKGTGTARGLSGSHKTAETKVSLQKRVDGLPDNSLIVVNTPNGKKLFCRCCPKELENILGTIKTHIGSKAHKDKLVRWIEKNKSDTEVKEFLEQYFAEHPEEKTASVSTEVQHYRWRVVEACLYAGIPMEKIDHLRELLERGGTELTASNNLKAMVPKIERFELERLRKELEGQRVCVIFDGTTRLGECIAVLLRWCPVGFTKIEQRLVALRTTKTHMNGDELGALINTIIGTTCRVQTVDVVCGSRDSCSTNGKAMRNLEPMYINMEAILCISHTLSHCGEHVDLPVLNEWMTPWLGLVQNHPSARSIWKDKLGGAMKGYSTIRWCSRDECSNEIAKNFGMLPDFVDTLL